MGPTGLKNYRLRTSQCKSLPFENKTELYFKQTRIINIVTDKILISFHMFLPTALGNEKVTSSHIKKKQMYVEN